MQFNLARILIESAQRHPDRDFLVVNDQVHSYAEIDLLSGRVAAALRAGGYEPGAAIGLRLPNSVDFVASYFGLLKAGLVVVPLNPLLSGQEIAHIAEDANLRAMIAAPDDVLLTEYQLPILTWGEAEGRHPSGDVADLAASVTDAVVAGAVHRTDGDDTAVIIYTSGTTGQPKGAELSHLQLFLSARLESEDLGLNTDDVMLGVLPLFHIFGLSGVLNSATVHGQSIVLLPRFSTASVLKASRERRISVIVGVPTMYVELLEYGLASADVATWRVLVSGGAPMPQSVIEQLEAVLPGASYVEGWGMTETCASGSLNGGRNPRRVGSIGRPVWGVELAVLDDDQVAGAPDVVGELLVRGHNVMTGYWNRPDVTADAFHDGWLRTGDLARLDTDGYAYIVGRVKDLIIRGGYNVYPREIEDVLFTHPAVVQAAIVGRPDERLGEEIVAYVVPREGHQVTSDELREYMRARVAPYKYPREVHLIDRLPTTATGKVDKRSLGAPVDAG
ncbi:AMP-binding protein [Streptomyces sp. MMCC 100]|uniref:AMP-binding protein n=1 Tax=Streptomyces sp. MMCC 100 TaxID=3163555 RepID=UPI00359645FA